MSERNFVIFLIVAIFTVLLAFSSMMGSGMMGPWMPGQWMMGYGGGWWMMLVMIAFWLIVGLGIYFLVTAFLPTRRRAEREGIERDRALAIARERYARGEITLEEFEKIKENLSGETG